MRKISKQNLIHNKFSRSNTNKIIKILNNIVSPSTTKSQLITLLNEQTQTNHFLFAIGQNPAYHLQYQLDSVAIMKINNFYLIVWKPKYIEYPQMIKFPQMKNIKNQSLNLQIDTKITNLSSGNQIELIDFLQKFYANYFRTDPHFQTNLVTYAKHFITKKTTINYWHCLYDEENTLLVKNLENMGCVVKIKVSGIKKGYNKCLLLFSCKGQREGVLQTISKKWVQTISFLAMVIIFISVVSCTSGQTEGFCQYRDDAMILGAGVMMSLFGLKLAKKYQSKGNKKAKYT